MTTVGLVVPAFRPDVEQTRAYVKSLHSTLEPAVIRIELDDPAAGTEAALSDSPADVHVSEHRRGKGTAITAGFDALTTDVRMFVDADGATPVHAVEEILTPVQTESVALAVGSRRHPEAHVRGHQGVSRRVLGDVFAWFAGRLLPAKLYDYQCGSKAITRDAWEAVRGHLVHSGFGWDIELVATAAALGYKIEEVPIEWEDQPGSTVSPIRDGFDMARTLVSTSRRVKRLERQTEHGPTNPTHTTGDQADGESKLTADPTDNGNEGES